MNCEVVAVGTELMLGQVVDTNSAWIGEQLAAVGIDSFHQTKVGDNHGRLVGALELALDRSDAVIVCGGLGPTPDDITRDALAAVMGAELVRDEAVAERIRSRFALRGREMAANNLRQADVPVGASVIGVQPGTAPGLVCPVRHRGRDKVIYAVPGVPWEMREMMVEVLSDLGERAGARSVIASRVLRTWGRSESGLAEVLDGEIARLDRTGEATIAFLASGWEGLKVRITARAADAAGAGRALDEVEGRVRGLIGESVFGTDGDTMESVVLGLLEDRGLTLGVAESLTGGLIAARLTEIAGASAAFRGGVVAYDRSVKTGLVGAPDVAAVSEEMALGLAERVCGLLGCDVGLATTGAAGPDPHEGAEPGTVWVGLWLDGRAEAVKLSLPFDRPRVRQFTTISALDLLRRRLLAGLTAEGPGSGRAGAGRAAESEGSPWTWAGDQPSEAGDAGASASDESATAVGGAGDVGADASSVSGGDGPGPGAELVEELDEAGWVVGVVSRAEMRAANLWHRNVIVMVRRSSGALVVHQRADWKDVFPSMWDVAFSGVPAVGEAWPEAAARELAEEAGLAVAPADLVDLGPRVCDVGDIRWHGRVFEVTDDRQLTPADGEVVALDEVPVPDLPAWMSQTPVCPDSIELIKDLFLA